MFCKIKLLISTRFFARHRVWAFIKRQLSNKNFNIVVDLGAGKSPYRRIFSCLRYVSVDIENRKKSSNQEIVLADVNQGIPLEENFADLVLATEFFEHIKEPDFVLSEVSRILKPGARLILTVPFVWPLHEKPNDFFRYTKYGLENLLLKNGFTDILIESRGGYFSMMGQLSIIFLRSRIFIPLVFLANCFILIVSFFEKDGDLTLGYQLSAIKK